MATYHPFLYLLGRWFQIWHWKFRNLKNGLTGYLKFWNYNGRPKNKISEFLELYRYAANDERNSNPVSKFKSNSICPLFDQKNGRKMDLQVFDLFAKNGAKIPSAKVCKIDVWRCIQSLVATSCFVFLVLKGKVEGCPSPPPIGARVNRQSLSFYSFSMPVLTN